MAESIITCNDGNEFDDSNLGVRISSVFVILVSSLAGALLPILAKRTRRIAFPSLVFFITKYFGSGVIIATAFIHLLAPANEALSSPCLTGPITNYDWAQGIPMITIFVMFFLELIASRFGIFSPVKHEEVVGPTSRLILRGDKTLTYNESRVGQDNSTSGETSSRLATADAAVNARARESILHTPSHPDDFTCPINGFDHLRHQQEYDEIAESFAAQMTAMFILEFGLVFHSIFIGLTLAVTGNDEFNVLYIVLTFHQAFEGLGLGSRLATTSWPHNKQWLPWTLGTLYALSTPVAIAVGLVIHANFAPGSQTTLITKGIFDAISAGILIYTGLVELMANEFLFDPEINKASFRSILMAFGCMCIGAGLMATLGRWA